MVDDRKATQGSKVGKQEGGNVTIEKMKRKRESGCNEKEETRAEAKRRREKKGDQRVRVS